MRELLDFPITGTDHKERLELEAAKETNIAFWESQVQRPAESTSTSLDWPASSHSGRPIGKNADGNGPAAPPLGRNRHHKEFLAPRHSSSSWRCFLAMWLAEKARLGLPIEYFATRTARAGDLSDKFGRGNCVFLRDLYEPT